MYKLISGHKYRLQIGLIECNSSWSVGQAAPCPALPCPAASEWFLCHFHCSNVDGVVDAGRFVKHIKYLVVKFVSTFANSLWVTCVKRSAFKSWMAQEMHEVRHKSNSLIDEIDFDM